MKLINSVLLSLASLALISCGGGSGSSTHSHSQLAKDFVSALNYDLNYDVELVKSNTKQWNYIVVYDYDLNTYDAYDLTNYYVGKDIDFHLDLYESDFFYDLDYIGGSVYEDYYTGIQFSKTKMTTNDTMKAQALVDGIKMKKAVNQLTVQFGLSDERAKYVAGIADQISKEANMTVYQSDLYSKALIGSTYGQIQGAVESKLNGDDTALDGLYERAASANNVSKASVKKLAELFIGIK